MGHDFIVFSSESSSLRERIIYSPKTVSNFNQSIKSNLWKANVVPVKVFNTILSEAASTCLKKKVLVEKHIRSKETNRLMRQVIIAELHQDMEYAKSLRGEFYSQLYWDQVGEGKKRLEGVVGLLKQFWDLFLQRKFVDWRLKAAKGIGEVSYPVVVEHILSNHIFKISFSPSGEFRDCEKWNWGLSKNDCSVYWRKRIVDGESMVDTPVLPLPEKQKCEVIDTTSESRTPDVCEGDMMVDKQDPSLSPPDIEPKVQPDGLNGRCIQRRSTRARKPATRPYDEYLKRF
ncbi:hypothetical protein ACOME3_007345 [Neoechinorhynchus agilis]